MEAREEDVVMVAEMAAAQVEAYGDGVALLRNEDHPRDENGFITQVFGKGYVRVLVPSALRSKVLKLVHGNRLGGHWGILRTAARVRCRYYWPGWASDVRKTVSECLDCKLGQLRRPRVQARMMRYHPSRRFQMVAMDVLEMSPESKRGNRKVLVIGDMFSRYVVAVPISDESADTVARVFFDRWVSVIGPPEQLLTDLGPNFASGVIAEMCRYIETTKVLTSAYHPQTNGFIQPYNRTQSTEQRRHVLDEEDWDLSLPMAVFRYNATQHAATGMTPYKAVLGSEDFVFDCGLLQRWNSDAEPEDLARRLAKFHAELQRKGLKSRDEAARAYNRAVDHTQFEEGIRVLVYDEADALAQGRKLRQPWLGPYRVEKRLSDVSYILRAENDASVARVHVNRMRGWTSDAE
jgi:transposase InsO family protein